jgi:ribose/xylose/arabinose/galactoside ABC-type transport system permease subunit
VGSKFQEVRAQELQSAPKEIAVHKSPIGRILNPDFWVLYLAIAYFLLMLPFTPDLGTPENLANIFSNILPLLIVATGQTFVIITAGIDLSVTSTIALTSVVGAQVMSMDSGFFANNPMAVPIALLAMLMTGAAIGLINGLAVARLRMPAFIVTLTTMMFFSGFAIWLTHSKNIYNLPDAFVLIGKGTVLSVPYALVVTTIIVLVSHLILSRNVLGRWLYAIGMSPAASRVSGVPVERTLILAYVISGLCAALASILYTARLETGSPVLGARILLDIVGAVVIGGTSLFGGKGKILWTIYGVLFMALIENTLNLIGLSYFAIMTVKGALILFAAFADSLRIRFSR